jgi:tungstate transport system ATP-binding protein
MSEAAVFGVCQLAFRYERKLAVRCEALEIRTGETVAFTGPNGSGKTTMLKLLNGLLGPYDGTIEFMGLPIRHNPYLRLRSVYVHQHPILFAGTVRDNLEFALRLKRIPRGDAVERIDRIAGRFGIEALLAREAARLSGGETQRVAVARAVAAGADVLLLDEPTSSLDAESESAVRSLLLELKRDGTTIVFSTHDECLVRDIADRVVRF